MEFHFHINNNSNNSNNSNSIVGVSSARDTSFISKLLKLGKLIAVIIPIGTAIYNLLAHHEQPHDPGTRPQPSEHHHGPAPLPTQPAPLPPVSKKIEHPLRAAPPGACPDIAEKPPPARSTAVARVQVPNVGELESKRKPAKTTPAPAGGNDSAELPPIGYAETRIVPALEALEALVPEGDATDSTRTLPEPDSNHAKYDDVTKYSRGK
jgi:hypothetical protein